MYTFASAKNGKLKKIAVVRRLSTRQKIGMTRAKNSAVRRLRKRQVSEFESFEATSDFLKTLKFL
jgi:hypothetical protein